MLTEREIRARLFGEDQLRRGEMSVGDWEVAAEVLLDALDEAALEALREVAGPFASDEGATHDDKRALRDALATVRR